MPFSKHLNDYESEFTGFLKDLKKKNPNLEQEQREGRNRLWDKPPVDLDDVKRSEVSRVKQQAYVYQSK